MKKNIHLVNGPCPPPSEFLPLEELTAIMHAAAHRATEIDLAAAQRLPECKYLVEESCNILLASCKYTSTQERESCSVPNLYQLYRNMRESTP